MENKKYKVLIIGLGNMGALNDAKGSCNEHKVISYAHALKEREDVFETWLFDIDEEKMKKASDIWEMPCDYSKICFDVIIIATPDNTHYGWLQLIVKSWYYNMPIKLVIVEKPLCSTVAEAKEIVKLYEEAGIPILVDYTRNFIPLYDILKDNEPIYGECYFNRGFLHSGTHGIATFEYLGIKDYKIKEVQCEDRVWNLYVKFKDGTKFTETRIGGMPVPYYFDYHTRYVIANAYNFLEGKEGLKCSMYDGLKCLEIMEKLMV